MTPIEEKTEKMFNRISRGFIDTHASREVIEVGFNNWLAVQDVRGDFQHYNCYWLFNKFVVQYEASDSLAGRMLFRYFGYLNNQTHANPNEAYDRAMKGI